MPPGFILKEHTTTHSLTTALLTTTALFSLIHGIQVAVFPAWWANIAITLFLSTILLHTGPNITGIPPLDALIKGVNAFLITATALQGLPHLLQSLPSTYPTFILTWLTLTFILRTPLQR